MTLAFKWEGVKIGVGVFPIKTEIGWLLIYHRVALEKERRIYRVGTGLFDLENSVKVVARLPYPILKPQEQYEREGDVSNVVFPVGAVVKDGILFILL